MGAQFCRHTCDGPGVLEPALLELGLAGLWRERGKREPSPRKRRLEVRYLPSFVQCLSALDLVTPPLGLCPCTPGLRILGHEFDVPGTIDRSLCALEQLGEALKPFECRLKVPGGDALVGDGE